MPAQETDSKFHLQLPPATIVVAAALPLLGIGKGNTLPWRIKAEMQYFKKITTKVSDKVLEYHRLGKVQNAVIMGKNTWVSIPPKFRPLPDRVNVVVSKTLKTPFDLGNNNGNNNNVLIASSLDRALELLAPFYWKNRVERGDHHHDNPDDVWIDKVFIIGGAQLYAAALEHPQTKAILLTTIQGLPSETELDTFFVSRDNHALRNQFLSRETNPDAEWIRQDIEALKEFIQLSDFNDFRGFQDDLSYEYGLWLRS